MRRVGGLAALVAMTLAMVGGAPASAATETALSGTHFGATDTSGSGGGIYQDDALAANPGDTAADRRGCALRGRRPAPRARSHSG